LGGRGQLKGATRSSFSATKPTSISILDDNTNQVFLKGGIARFEKQTGIKVAAYDQLNFEELAIKLPTLFASGSSSYDVVMTWAGWTAEFGSAGWLQKLNASDMPAGVLNGPKNAVTWGNRIYGVPKFASVQTMFYNKRLFSKAGLDPDKPPTDWSQFVQMARTLTGAHTYGYLNDMGGTEGTYQNFMRTLLLCGGEMWDKNYKIQFNSPAGVKAMTDLRNLHTTQKVLDPASLGITNSTDLAPIFAGGTAAMVFDWPYLYSPAAKGLGADNVGIAIIPGVTVRSASIDGSEGFSVNSFSHNKSAALEWLRFAASPYVQRRMVLEESWLPVTESLLTEPDLIKALPVIPVYGQQTKYTIQRYGAPWYSQVCEEDLGTSVTQVMLGQVSPKQALDQAASQGQAVIDTYLGR
jgi:multiple sugar transport system substrate-binding protein